MLDEGNLEDKIVPHYLSLENAKYTPPYVGYNLDILGRNMRPDTGIVLYSKLFHNSYIRVIYSRYIKRIIPLNSIRSANIDFRRI